MAFDNIWVKRDSKDFTPIKISLKTLKNGGCLGIFPEGTRNGMEKNNGELKNALIYGRTISETITKFGNSEFADKPTNYYNLDMIISVG